MAFDVQSRQQGRINSSRDCGEIYLASRLALWFMSYASDKSRGTCPACALEVTTLCLFVFLVEISLVT